MKLNKEIEIVHIPEYGAVLKCRDIEMADQFEDYLAESCFVFFNVKMEPEEISFFFGQASSVDKVEELFEKFSLAKT